MRILYAASEAAPFAKSGGLADVAGALPKALVKDGVDARVIMPLYGDLKFRDTHNNNDRSRDSMRHSSGRLPSNTGLYA